MGSAVLGGPLSIEIWEGTAQLTGYAALVAEDKNYPIRTGSVNDEIGERVDLQIFEPVQVTGPLDLSMYRQDVKLRVSSAPLRVQELAMETLLVTADAIAFAADRKVQTSLSHLINVTSTSQDDNSEGNTSLFMRRFKGPQELVALNAGFLAYLWKQLDDIDSDHGRRVIRALRWLRRASVTDDEVEEFATMMMGFDGLKRLLPQPPAKGHGKKRGKGRQSPSKQGINAILGNWAVRRCGITREDWGQVWALRNQLFHGDLTENADTRSKLADAIPHLRLALGLALKHVLGLPQDAPPHLSLPLFTITDIQITGPRFTPVPAPSPHEPDDVGDFAPGS